MCNFRCYEEILNECLNRSIVDAVIFQFEDSDVGVDDIYNTVEIETSDTSGHKAENTVNKDGNITMSNQQVTSDPTPSVSPFVTTSSVALSVAPSVTINDSENSQGITHIIIEAVNSQPKLYF